MRPEKPDWFEPVLTAWKLPEEIPCAKQLPRSANFVADVLWAFAPGMERCDQYHLSKNRGRKHLILWVGSPNEEGRGWTCVPVAYGPAKSPDGEPFHEWHAVLHLLVAAWTYEKKQTADFQPPQEVRGPLAGEDFEVVCRKVWPEYWEDSASAIS